ncbi:MAG: potassium transporter Kef [Desulfobulbaceae bacterium]|nr:MAG: potassium transporter Kef [Desulfobulbaceae bacterium]
MDDLLWIGPALISGIAASRFNLPPMVGYLLCGFVLNLSGVYDHDRLTMIGNLGVTLLLFTIGLKLDLRSLFRPVIWAGTTIHTFIVVSVFGTLIYWASLAGLKAFMGIDFTKALLIGFALSFSSTVFAVKTLDDKGEYHSKYGQTAIGILIMQDIFAVIFLAASTGTLPSVWALGLMGLIPLRIFLMHLLRQAGHSSELQTLYGLALAFGGYALFDAVDVKGDLGALIIGAMLATHPLAEDVSKRLLAFKDILLVGFFLSIGMSGNLTLFSLSVALLLSVLVIFKTVLFFGLFTRFGMRGRRALLSSLTLSNYSEFGLIVGALSVASGWLTEDWLVTIALALTMTIIIASPINANADQICDRLRSLIRRFETKEALPEDELPDFNNAKVTIVGMGRLGTTVYDALIGAFGESLIGIDSNPEVVEIHQHEGRNVICADATDDEMWERTAESEIKIGVLTLNLHQENLGIIGCVKERNPKVILFGYAQYEDEVEELIQSGAKKICNMYSKIGIGLATEVIDYEKSLMKR